MPTDQDFADLTNRVSALEQRDADLTEGLKRLVLGRPTGGADSAAAEVVALEGGADADLQPAAVAPPADDPATLILAGAGLVAGPEQLRLMNAWIQAEGGDGHNNPLNVSAPLDRRWSWPGQAQTGGPYNDGFWNHLPDDFGVCIFNDMADGCAACSHVIGQTNMSAIRSALQSGDASTFVLAIRQDPWGTDANDVVANLGV